MADSDTQLVDDIITIIDSKLYQGKHSGKNKIVF